jgi:hypothetical protein
MVPLFSSVLSVVGLSIYIQSGRKTTTTTVPCISMLVWKHCCMQPARPGIGQAMHMHTGAAARYQQPGLECSYILDLL